MAFAVKMTIGRSLNGWMARVYEVPMLPIKCCKYMTFKFSCNKSSILVYILIWVASQKSMTEYWSRCFGGRDFVVTPVVNDLCGEDDDGDKALMAGWQV
jgi:hypothetical protein